jgi:hypothetical protein
MNANQQQFMQEWQGHIQQATQRIGKLLREAEAGCRQLIAQNPDDPMPVHNALNAINVQIQEQRSWLGTSWSDLMLAKLMGSLDNRWRWEVRLYVKRNHQSLSKVLGGSAEEPVSSLDHWASLERDHWKAYAAAQAQIKPLTFHLTAAEFATASAPISMKMMMTGPNLAMRMMPLMQQGEQEHSR